jgi:hypothetical protein
LQIPIVRFRPPRTAIAKPLRVEHVPFISKNPAQGRKLAVEYAPLEVIPRSEIFQADFILGSFCRRKRGCPRGVQRLIWLVGITRILAFGQNLVLSTFYFAAEIPMAVIPDLAEQQMLRFENVG